MEKDITLDYYLSLLGKLKNINVEKACTTYYDKNQNKSISSITTSRVSKPSFGNPTGVQLYNVAYCDGSSAEYAGCWIQVNAEFELSEKYK